MAEKLAPVIAAFLESLPAGPDRPPTAAVVYVLVNTLHSVTHEGLLHRPDLPDEILAGEALRLVRGYLAALRG